MRGKSISKKVFLGNLVITLVSFLVVFSVICYFVCVYQVRRLEADERKAMEQYAWEIDSAISDGISEGSKILALSAVQELFSSTDAAVAVNYTISSEIKMFLDNMSWNNSVRYVIYSENPNTFSNQYVERAESLENYDSIKQSFNKAGVYLNKNVLTDESGHEFIQLYIDSTYYKGGLLECNIYMPEPDVDYDMSVVPNSAELSEGEIREKVNADFDVSIKTDVTRKKLTVINTIVMFCIVALAFLGVVLFITYRTTRKTMQGVTDFISGLNEDETYMTDGYFNIKKDDPDEVRTIKSVVGELLVRMKEITESHNRIEAQKREQDIHMLRKQLDPHTLYNSLSAIKLNAFMKHDTDTIKLVDTMIEYYRATLNKGNTFLSLRDEISMIEKFLNINEMAHGQRFKLYYEISESLMNFRVPSMLLHVFVENCVVHGLCGNKKDCRIDIMCREQNERVIITIEDNGYGISEEKLKALNEMSEDYKGYGIKNAYQRMKMTYGDDVSVKYDSVQNEWTCVTINIPNKSE